MLPDFWKDFALLFSFPEGTFSSISRSPKSSSSFCFLKNLFFGASSSKSSISSSRKSSSSNPSLSFSFMAFKNLSNTPILFSYLLLSQIVIAFSEDTCSDSNHGSTFLDCNLIISGHTHTQNTHSNIINVFGCNVNT